MDNAHHRFTRKLLALFFLCICLYQSPAYAVPVTELYFTSGAYNGYTYDVYSQVNSTFNLLSGYSDSSCWDHSVPQTGPAPCALLSFDFQGSGIWVNAFTAASSAQTGALGGPVPTATVKYYSSPYGEGYYFDDLNMNSFFINWNGQDISEGFPYAMGGLFQIAPDMTFPFSTFWNSTTAIPVPDSGVDVWEFRGYGVVPLPAAGLLFGSGVAMLMGMLWRKKSFTLTQGC